MLEYRTPNYQVFHIGWGWNSYCMSPPGLVKSNTFLKKAITDFYDFFDFEIFFDFQIFLIAPSKIYVKLKLLRLWDLLNFLMHRIEYIAWIEHESIEYWFLKNLANFYKVKTFDFYDFSRFWLTFLNSKES